MTWFDNLVAPALLLTAIGWFVKFYLDWTLETKKTRLKFLNDQVQYLYGPLTAISKAGNEAVRVFLEDRGRPQNEFFDRDALTISDLQAYRNWIKLVGQPNNIRMENVILEHMHLFIAGKMPQIYNQFLAHVSVYKAQIAAWDADPISSWPKSLSGDKIDYEKMEFQEVVKRVTAIEPFPPKFYEKTAKTFAKLQNEQKEILSSMEFTGIERVASSVKEGTFVKNLQDIIAKGVVICRNSIYTTTRFVRNRHS